ncbi:partial Dodecaprenyl-phosphate galacturonate synthase, partial [Gammaproteobacteria bacterium]
MAPRLSIVIPALNEEDAIGATLTRCLEARPHITKHGGVDSVEILVVSDGSTDATERIACGFPEVHVAAFDRNRGYGAAIRCGFDLATGDLLGFLDADGTCDPRIFAELCAAIERAPADVALGSRMGAGSEMPLVRTVGNLLFAWLLGILARSTVKDTASGMRVIRRTALVDLYPLPDGLHFTPAMSARALLEGKLRL